MGVPEYASNASVLLDRHGEEEEKASSLTEFRMDDSLIHVEVRPFIRIRVREVIIAILRVIRTPCHRCRDDTASVPFAIVYEEEVFLDPCPPEEALHVGVGPGGILDSMLHDELEAPLEFPSYIGHVSWASSSSILIKEGATPPYILPDAKPLKVNVPPPVSTPALTLKVVRAIVAIFM